MVNILLIDLTWFTSFLLRFSSEVSYFLDNLDFGLELGASLKCLGDSAVLVH